MMKRKMAGIGAGFAAAALMLSGCSQSVQLPDRIQVENAGNAENTISVSGSETVKAEPDMAQIEYAVTTQAGTAAECQAANSADLDKALETLKGLGVAETSIQTAGYGLNPIYDWNSGTQSITGYEMTTTITVTDIAIGDAGKILSQSVAAGVNQINSVSYFSSRYDESYGEALAGAIAQARAKAEAIASASGKTVVSVGHVEESGYNPQARYASGAVSMKNASMEAGAVADMAVMPGQVEIEAQVQVDFIVEQQ